MCALVYIDPGTKKATLKPKTISPISTHSDLLAMVLKAVGLICQGGSEKTGCPKGQESETLGAQYPSPKKVNLSNYGRIL